MRKTQTRKSINIKDKEDLIYHQLRQSKFFQQRLPAWRPVPTLCAIIIFYTIFSLIFIAIGVVLLIFSNQIKEIEKKYNEQCRKKENEENKECQIDIEIPEDMDKPIFIYYKLYGFFQNNRRFMKSKSQKQLMGETTTLDEMKSDEDCDPIYTNADMGFEVDRNPIEGNTPLSPNELAIPCGIMAKAFFNDNFKTWKINEEEKEIEINEKNIAWNMDKELFKNSDKSKQWTDIEDEHFIVWMRPAGLPDFRKLWGRIEKRDLKKGDKLHITVENNYDVDKFSGDKSIILSTSNVFGGDNTFLGICFVVVGGISLLLGIGFIINHFIQNKGKEKEK